MARPFHARDRVTDIHWMRGSVTLGVGLDAMAKRIIAVP
jgi:hypothetical protein